MEKYYLFIAMAIALNGCSWPTDTSYQKNPHALEIAIKDCQKQPSESERCKKINRFAYQVSYLAYQLQINPQAFGLKVLSLQTALSLKHDVSEIKQMTEDMNTYLTVIRWFESPEDSL